jgi:hypothetical protein
MFYVYVYLDPLYPIYSEYGDLKFDNLPIYIGKGKANRCKDHLHKTNNPIFRNKIKCWKRKQIEPIIVKLHENLTEQEAWDLEKKYIAAIGRLDKGIGPLLNLTDGGEGPSGVTPWNKGKQTGWVPSEDARARMSAAHKGKPKSAETRAKMSAASKGRPKTDKHKANLSKAGKGKSHHPHKGKTGVWSQDQLDKWSESHKKSWTPKRRAEWSERMKGRKLTEEHKRNVVEARLASGYTHDEETRKLMSQKRKEYWEKKRQDAAKKEPPAGDQID